MRICYITTLLTELYGGSRSGLCLASELGKLDNVVDVYTHKCLPECARLVYSNNIKIVETGFPRITNHDLGAVFDYLFVFNLVFRIRGRFDLFIVQGARGSFAGLLTKKLLTKYRGVPIISYTDEMPRFAFDMKVETLASRKGIKKFLARVAVPIVKFIDRVSIRNLDQVVVNGEWAYEQFKRVYGLDCPIVYPSIDTERFKKYAKQDAKSSLGFNDEVKVFITISKLTMRKRVNEALRVYLEYSEKFSKSHFFIIGDGPELERLKKIADEMSIRTISFLGNIFDDDILSIYYSAADYFIFTAKNEPFGLAPYEAKAAGCELIPADIIYPVLRREDSAKKMLQVYEQIINEH